MCVVHVCDCYPRWSGLSLFHSPQLYCLSSPLLPPSRSSLPPAETFAHPAANSVTIETEEEAPREGLLEVIMSGPLPPPPSPGGSDQRLTHIPSSLPLLPPPLSNEIDVEGLIQLRIAAGGREGGAVVIVDTLWIFPGKLSGSKMEETSRGKACTGDRVKSQFDRVKSQGDRGKSRGDRVK